MEAATIRVYLVTTQSHLSRTLDNHLRSSFVEQIWDCAVKLLFPELELIIGTSKSTDHFKDQMNWACFSISHQLQTVGDRPINVCHHYPQIDSWAVLTVDVFIQLSLSVLYQSMTIFQYWKQHNLHHLASLGNIYKNREANVIMDYWSDPIVDWN